ncbi:MAG: response regulator [Polyangiaceae bacterium]|nr:response regulator [Polyangiaceae bacterium]
MDSPLFVVGIGASAGGLDSLERLFAQMPSKTGMAFIVVQHLSPDFRSVMDELLARRTGIPIMLVEDGVRVEADHIYLIPPKKEMIISGGRLLLSDKGTSAELTLPIDIFFRSLAQDAGPRAIGVILSGAGSDGARGIRDIHEAGGFVVCQDEESAAFDGMPRSALDTGVVDHVAQPAAIPGVLVDYVQRMNSGDYLPAIEAQPASRGLGAVFRLLQHACGIDFSNYKPNTVIRRVERRLHITQTRDLDAYVDRLTGDPDELDALYRDLLIGVTRFFRDQEAFELLERTIIPEMLARTSGDELRIWVPGCATGEEAYSLAILCHEQLLKNGDKRRLKIFATDVHQGSLDFASRGLYAEDSFSRMSPARLERYFERQGGMAQVSSELRQAIVFARHNVIREAPFTRLDLVSCRNLLIYLQPLAQKRAIGLFHFALKHRGILFLGPSESTGALADDFETLNQHWRIYRKHREHRVAPETRMILPRRDDLRVSVTTLAGGQYSLAQTMNIYDSLLEEHMPPSLLVDERRTLIHTFGGAARFTRIRDGRPSLDVLDVVDPDLRAPLGGALQRATKDSGPVVYRGVNLQIDGEPALFKLTVRRFVSKNAAAPHFLVQLERTNQAPKPPSSETQIDLDEISRERVENLELELRYTKETLQATIEEVETSNEELQAANEELTAANEELQSTNEELQSVNEELYTVNAEYQKKIAQLTELTNDMDNLLQSTEIGTIFLDQELCIRKFTPRMHSIFNLLPQDVGRSLASFRNTLNDGDLMVDIASCQRSGRVIEREIRDPAGNWFFLRILPYRTGAGAAQGVVLTLVDINSLKLAENALFRERYLLESLMNSVPDAIYFKDAKGRFVRVNPAMARRLGIDDPTQAIGRHAASFGGHDITVHTGADRESSIDGEGAYRLEQTTSADGVHEWLAVTRHKLRDADGADVGTFGVARDVTKEKAAEDEIRSAVVRRDQFLAMLSHELRNPLSAVAVASRMLSQHVEDPSGKKFVSIIDRQSHQMTRLLDDLLDANRITHNKIELNRRVFDLRTVVEEAVAVVQTTARGAAPALMVNLPEHPVLVRADRVRLQQVVINVLGNALKFTPAEGNIALRLSAQEERAVLLVKDDGAGMDSALLANIFELFVQGAPTLARTEGGIGVGLALVRKIVQLHGGDVRAHSDGPGKGSEFCVELPLAEHGAVPDYESRRPVAPASPILHVVLVDDNPDGCDMMRALLESLGHKTDCAYDGVSAVEMIQKAKPHVAIIDVGLPKLNGYEVVARLRTDEEPSTYLVALTGYGRPEDRTAAIEAGFHEHLVKPLRFDDLRRVLDLAATKNASEDASE